MRLNLIMSLGPCAPNWTRKRWKNSGRGAGQCPPNTLSLLLWASHDRCAYSVHPAAGSSGGIYFCQAPGEYLRNYAPSTLQTTVKNGGCLDWGHRLALKPTSANQGNDH